MTTHDQAFAAALDKIPTIKPSAELVMITLGLLDEIRIASRPGTLAPVYRPATAAAMSHARQAFRAVVAMVSREELKRLMQQAATRPDRLRGVPTKDDVRMVLGRSHVND